MELVLTNGNKRTAYILNSIAMRVVDFAMLEILTCPTKFSAHFFNCFFLRFDIILPLLPVIYLFDPDDIMNNINFNEDDKILIKKCCELLKYLYNLEAGEELTKENKAFYLSRIQEFKDVIAKRKRDVYRDYYEEDIKYLKFNRLERVRFKRINNLDEILCEESQNNNEHKKNKYSNCYDKPSIQINLFNKIKKD